MAQYYRDTQRYTSPEPRHRLIEGFFDNHITLQQINNRSFLVRYGCQVDHDLTYSEATKRLGEAILHHLTAEGKVAVG